MAGADKVWLTLFLSGLRGKRVLIGEELWGLKERRRGSVCQASNSATKKTDK